MPDSAVSLPMFGFGLGTKSPNVSSQMRENLYVEKLDDPDKTALALYARPGLRDFAQVQGTILGIIGDVQLSAGLGGEFMLVATDAIADTLGNGFNLFRINGAGSVASLQAFDDASALVTSWGGVVRGASSGTEFVFTDGVNGYHVNATSPFFTTARFGPVGFPNATGFPAGCKSVCYIASRFVCDDPSNPGRFRWSAAGDGTSWNTLDFATAESNPDALTAVFEVAGQLVLFGSSTTEFWSPSATGASNQLPFQRVGGANIQWGTTSIDTIRKANNAVMFMGRSLGGNRQVVLLQGYDAQVVSTPDVELEIQNDPAPDAARAHFFIANGHPFYVLNLTSASWAYDLRTQSWSKWTTAGSRFAGQWGAPAFGEMILSDYRDGHLYAVDPSLYTDNGTTMVRELVSKHASANLARLSLAEIAVDCETGVGSPSDTPDGTPPQIMLQWSKDGGHTWGNEVWQSLGPAGGYLKRAVWRMLGRSRDWLFKLRVTDNVKVVIIGAAATVKP